jgi:hypothetical protein
MGTEKSYRLLPGLKAACALTEVQLGIAGLDRPRPRWPRDAEHVSAEAHGCGSLSKVEAI